MKGAFYTGEYRNVFAELGIAQEEIDQRIEETFQTMYYGSEEERIYQRTWDIWKIRAMWMPGRKECPMA